MQSKGTAILNQLNKKRSNYVASCRFFKNYHLDHTLISQPLLSNTAQAVNGKDVLVIYDTTELNYESHAGYLNMDDNDLGPVGNENIGFFLHPSIVIDKNTEMLLGASDVYIWNRPYGKPNGKARNYRAQPLITKESNRWIERANKSKEVLETAKSILFIADREADIYEEFVFIPDKRCDILIRSCQNRKVNSAYDNLYSHISAQDEVQKIELLIKENEKRTPRKAELSLKFCPVEIKRSVKGYDKTLPESIHMFVIELKENDKHLPRGEKPIRWVLLTTKPVHNAEQAMDMIKCYATRWQIELIFGTLKSKGLNVELSELETGRGLKSLVAMALIVAIKINQLRMARNDENNLNARIIFTDSEINCLKVLSKQYEGKTESQMNQFEIGSLRWSAWIIARLGGWKGYKSESPPGNKTMKIGWMTFNQIYQGWLLAQN